MDYRLLNEPISLADKNMLTSILQQAAEKVFNFFLSNQFLSSAWKLFKLKKKN